MEKKSLNHPGVHYIQTQDTPNPNSMKFLANCDISPDNVVFINNQREANQLSTLAAKIFAIGDISGVFLGSDFITVTKMPQTDWAFLKPEIIMIITDHLLQGLPIVNTMAEQNKDQQVEDLSDVERQIVEVINTRVRPSVAMDGGDVLFREFKDGVVYLELHGSCSGCPSSTITLKNGIESMLQHFIPEVISVEEYISTSK